MASVILPPRTIKRVLHDLAELERNPISGVSLCMPNQNQPFLLHGNVVIKFGVYKGLLIHLILGIPPDFPLSPPAAHIAPGLGFNHNFHHHIYNESTGNTICNNLVSNFGMFGGTDEFGRPERSGWIPAYTLGSLMLQLQVFFADPDYGEHWTPDANEVKKLREHVRSFELDITVDDGSDVQKVVKHTFTDPYPPFSNLPKKVAPKGEEAKENIVFEWTTPIKKIPKSVTPTKTKIVKAAAVSDSEITYRLLTQKQKANKFLCTVSKATGVDSEVSVFGYPINIVQKVEGDFVLNALSEVMSLEAFMLNFPEEKLPVYGDGTRKFLTGLRCQFSVWLPAYINESHFERAQPYILTAIYELFRLSMEKRYSGFEPFMVLQIFPHLIAQALTSLLQENTNDIAVDVLYQLLQLFAKLLKVFPELQSTIDYEVANLCLSSKDKWRGTTGSLEEFLVMIALSGQKIHDIEVINFVLRKHIARQKWIAFSTPESIRTSLNPIREFMAATKALNQLLMVQIKILQVWNKYYVREEYKSNSGFPDEDQVKRVKTMLKSIKGSISHDWRTFVNQLGQDSIVSSGSVMKKYIRTNFFE